MTHLVLSTALFVLVWRFFYLGIYSSEYHLKGELSLYFLYAVILFLLCRIYEVYSIGYKTISDLVFSGTLADIISAGIIWIVSILMYMKLTNPLSLVAMCVLQIFINIVWSLVIRKVYDAFRKHKRTVLVYEDEEDLKRLGEIRKFTEEFNIQKYIKDPHNYKALEKELEGFETIVVSGVHATLRNGIAKYCIEKDIPGYFAPHVGDIIMQGAKPAQCFTVPILSVRRKSQTTEYLIIKRFFDVLISVIAMIVFSPTMIISALIIKLYDGGPVFYKQTRLTKDGRLFRIYKFRSMKVGAEKDGIARLSTGKNDTRVTPYGRFIRACRIDEIPQLINIIKGDMSIVGPRPERPEIASEYEKEIPAFALRLQVKAGLTGYAQVFGKYNTSPYDKLEMDLMYINRMSVVEDLRLMLATVRILFKPESTEGVAVEQTVSENKKKEPVCSRMIG